MIAWSMDGTNTMTAVRDEAVPHPQQLRIGGVYVTRLIFWLDVESVKRNNNIK